MAVFLRPPRRRARPLPVRWGRAVRVVLLLAALLHGQYPALRAATDPCASPYALARTPQRLARPASAITLAPANLAVQAPPSHRSAPPLQPPRPS